MYFRVVVFSILVSWSSGSRIFPSHFKFGAATSAYQVEGAWNVSDKGESVWDRYLHTKPGVLGDGTNGDVACDSYHLWRHDVEVAKEMGVQFYRFSINWPRLLPRGLATHISKDGKDYYNNLIDELLRNGIEPLITIYHFELPQRLQDLGGWTNPLITDWFADYARVVFSLFGDRVKTWLTLNEPLAICDFAYNMGIIAPGLVDQDFSSYICTKNVMIAHAKAWRVYDEEFKARFGGKVSLANQLIWFEPATPEDEEITELAREYYSTRYIYPIYSEEGGWPPVLEKFVAEKSKREGHTRSRLPAFTKEEIKLVKDTYDYFGLNYYTSRLVRRGQGGSDDGSLLDFNIPEIGAVLDASSEWEPAFKGSWMFQHPPGLRKQMSWLKQFNPDVEILITEIGFPSEGQNNLNDDARVNNLRENLEQVLLAIEEDGVNVTGYTAWSLIDSFEWMDGYNTRFGLYEVDFSSPLRTRTARKSGRYYGQIIRSRTIDNYRDEL